MIVYLFRHAQKISTFVEDPPLTAAGHLQSLQLADKVILGQIKTPNYLWSSPKLRAVQTLTPLAKALNKPLELNTDLLERTYTETRLQFLDRIENVFRACVELGRASALQKDSSSPVIYLCSHHDWIEEALEFLKPNNLARIDQAHYWQPCQYMSFHYDQANDEWSILEFDRIHV